MWGELRHTQLTNAGVSRRRNARSLTFPKILYLCILSENKRVMRNFYRFPSC